MVLWKIAPYAAALALLAAFGVYCHHQGVKSSDTHWQARWDARDASEALVMAAAISKQLADKSAAEQRNREIENALAQKDADVASARADAAFAKRLLSAAARPSGNSSPVPKTDDKPITAPAGKTAGDAGSGQLLGLLADFRAECRANADTLDALNAELTPELSR